VAQAVKVIKFDVPSGRTVKVVESEVPSGQAVKVVKLEVPSCRSVRVVESDHNSNAFLRDHKPNNTFPRDPPQLLTFQTHFPKTSDFTG